MNNNLNKFFKKPYSYDEIDHDLHASAMIQVVYFQFTSLSTVGFGDYHPQSDFERFICTFILLVGVLMFSFIMGYYIKIMDKVKEMS